MSNVVKMVECPRAAWQGLPVHIPAEVKADYLRVLIAAGFRRIDAAGFAPASAVPQMADTEKVLEYLEPAEGDVSGPVDVEMMAQVVSAKGAERAIRTGGVQVLVFPYSISPGFLEKKQSQTPEEALEVLERVGEMGYKAGLDVAATIEMAFGNPFGDAWSIDEVVDACDLLIDSGVRQITLVDTAAMATPKLVNDLVRDVMAVHEDVEVGLHLYARYDGAKELVRSAYDAGCRRFHTVLGGHGAPVVAGDLMVGNLATELVLEELRALGAEVPGLAPLDGLLSASAEMARRYGAKVQ